MSDIDIKSNDGDFKLRVCGIIFNDNKVLVEKNDDMYALPGGHVEFGELTSTTIIREVKEEIKLDSEIDRLFCINENIYTHKDKLNQEIGYYYILKPIGNYSKEDFKTDEIDKGVYKEHTFVWIPINELLNYPLYPKAVIEMLSNKKDTKNNIIAYDERKVKKLK